MIGVTDHALRRLRKRVGIPKRACRRHVEKAFIEGESRDDVSGLARVYLDNLYLKNPEAGNIRVYLGAVYVFADEALVTVFHLPVNLKNFFGGK